MAQQEPMTLLRLTLSEPFRLPSDLERPIVVIGNFDGVHRGHQALLAAAGMLAGQKAHPVVLLTFDPHPRTFFRPDEPVFTLTSLAQKSRLAHDYGAAGVVAATFDSDLAALTAEAFMAEVLVKRLGASGVVIGPDFHFGQGRRGTPALMAEWGARLGFATTVLPLVVAQDAPVSSSAIRAALAAGDLATANRLLGHEWRIEGIVAHGDKRGRELGYPTANILLAPSIALRHGIYAVRATVGGASHAAVASFGRRPTFDDGAPRLEVHLFDFSGDLYGQVLDVQFVAFIRPELKFDSVEALITQMDADSGKSRALLRP
jgi:riboflavin kinase / FMN adenylyltransferase